MLRLTPVLAKTTGQERSVPVRDRVKNQSSAAREAVRRSSIESGLHIEKLDKDERDVPQPDGEIYWSLSHTSLFVAGVVAPYAIGVDVEGPRKVREELVHKIVSEAETKVLGGRNERAFLRSWTAKESFLKCIGLGIAGLSRCHIVAAPSNEQIHLEFDSKTYLVHQTTLANHVAALCLATPMSAEVPEITIDWILP